MNKKSTARAVDRITEMIASLLMRSAIKPLPSVDERSLLDSGLSRSDVIACHSSAITPRARPHTQHLSNRQTG